MVVYSGNKYLSLDFGIPLFSINISLKMDCVILLHRLQESQKLNPGPHLGTSLTIGRMNRYYGALEFRPDRL